MSRCCESCRSRATGVLPGLPEVALSRSGYGAALRRMLGRLSGADRPGLRGLTDRSATAPMDPAIALIDAWACLGHVLGFYTDRLVNEHYLRTCRELRSATGLARLVGYAARPGLAADVDLAFTLDDVDPEATLVVPAGIRVYSQPGLGETMQPFETVDGFSGRPRWNVLRPRMTQPAQVTRESVVLDLRGITTGLVKGSKLLVTSNVDLHRCVTVASVRVFPEQDRTRVWLAKDPVPQGPRVPVQATGELLRALLKPPAAAARRLDLDPRQVFESGRSYAAYGLLAGAYPGLRETLGTAVGGSAHAEPTGTAGVQVLRVRARLHGGNAPLIPARFDPDALVVTEYQEWNEAGTGAAGGVVINGDGPPPLVPELEPLEPDEIALDGVHDGILEDSLVVVESPPDPPIVRRVAAVRTAGRVNFNVPAQVTILKLGLDEGEVLPRNVRRVVVHAQPEPLLVAETPITEPVCAGELVLDGYYDGLHPGRRVIVTGERTDLPAGDDAEVTGVAGTESVLIATVEHRVGNVAGQAQAGTDTVHTVVSFADPDLQYCYRRETVTMLANVAPATHGESRAEVLGSGDASLPLQSLPVKQGPITHVSAVNAAGSRSTLEVRVDDLRWTEAPHAAAVTPGQRAFLVRSDGVPPTAIFGLGARLPTGAANVRALYRSGLGRAGNVRPGQVNVLASRPNGVTAAVNPRAATGGVEPDDAEAVRRRAPIGLAALDRLVSAADAADFARAFAGIGKAAVVQDGGPHRHVLTVAGVDDAPLTASSAVVRGLRAALARFGDLEDPPAGGPLTTRGAPPATIDVRVRTALLLAVRARIGLAPDHLWEAVRPRLEARLRAAFGFAAAELGAVPRTGAVIAEMQAVRGVAWVDLLAFGKISIGTPDEPRTPEDIAASALALFQASPADPAVGAGEIAYLSPDAPGTLLLELAEESP
jgi:predicted phage baseplate assembly protein